MESKELVKKSKYLSLILRHDPAKANLTLDEHGWVLVNTLLKSIGWGLFELVEVVQENDKKRFEFSENGKKIRASQGHSVYVDLGYEIKEPPEFLYHGTSSDNNKSISERGLLKRDRHDVHLFDDKDKAFDIAKNRRRNHCVLTISAKQMSEDGFQFRLSTNNVWLTETVPPKYIVW
jgi:putative RNA 2'-phosphotransferase